MYKVFRTTGGFYTRWICKQNYELSNLYRNSSMPIGDFIYIQPSVTLQTWFVQKQVATSTLEISLDNTFAQSMI